MTIHTRSKPGYIEVKFQPEWIYISCIQTFVMAFFAVSCVEPLAAQRIALIITELLENAIKYSSGRQALTRIAVEDSGNQVKAQVSNTASEENITELKRTIEDINKYSPQEAYLKRLEKAATRTDEKSQVGLARVRFEGRADLQLNIEGSEVSMTALYKLD
ncbi:MAG: hypothetical protein JSV08_04065 [Acidobacteriota bacterium]|nr:MAG: hypothetical protein JSV08_04065 [Acidobacteriota bacterium]